MTKHDFRYLNIGEKILKEQLRHQLPKPTKLAAAIQKAYMQQDKLKNREIKDKEIWIQPG